MAVTDSIGALNVGSLLMSMATAEDCLKPLSRGPGSGVASTKFCYDPVAWILCDPSCLVSPLRINTNPGSPWPWSLVEASYRNCRTGSLSAGRARTPWAAWRRGRGVWSLAVVVAVVYSRWPRVAPVAVHAAHVAGHGAGKNQISCCRCAQGRRNTWIVVMALPGRLEAGAAGVSR
jgi:hypothetical protein